MFCTQCGTQIPDNSKFCNVCGAPVGEAPAVQQPFAPVQPTAPQVPAKKKRGVNPVIIIFAAILIVVASLIGGIAVFNSRTVARVLDPNDFFGVEGTVTDGGSDINLMFVTENDPAEMIRAYLAYADENNENITVKVTEDSYSIDYVISYTGFWLGNSKPSLMIFDYGNDYYGTDTQNYSFRFRCDSNFKFVACEPYEQTVINEAADSTPEVSASEASSAPENTETEPETGEAEITVSGPTLPDPQAFLGGAAYMENKPEEYTGWLVSFNVDLADGWTAGLEYVELLQDPRFQLELRDKYEDQVWDIIYEEYYFDYVGDEVIEPASGRVYHDGYVDYSADVYVSVQRGGERGTTYITVTYSNDLLVQDFGDRASIVPGDAQPNSNNDSSDSGAINPDFNKEPCLTCDGDGDCTECNGYGTIKRYNGDGDYIDSTCPECHGNRKCRICNGSGKRE